MRPEIRIDNIQILEILILRERKIPISLSYLFVHDTLEFNRLIRQSCEEIEYRTFY